MSVKNETVYCSFCESENVKLIAPFGTAQLVRQYYCNDCQSIFEYIRWREEDNKDHAENARKVLQK
jgi:transposase-like protein